MVIHSPLFAESLAVIIAVLHGSIWYYLLLWRFLVQLAKRAWPGSKVSAFPSGEHSQYSPLYPFNLSIGTSSRFLRAVTKVFLVSNDSVHHFHLIALHLINFALYVLLGWLALHHVHLIPWSSCDLMNLIRWRACATGASSMRLILSPIYFPSPVAQLNDYMNESPTFHTISRNRTPIFRLFFGIVLCTIPGNSQR